MVDGKKVNLYIVEFPGQLLAKFTNYGGVLTELHVPDKDGNLGDVVLGFTTLEEYLMENPYFGAVVGRYGNRIANGQFSIGNNHFQLARNNGPNSLHGGLKGFDKVVWDEVNMVNEDNHVEIQLSYTSHHLEEGFPGNLEVQVSYKFTPGEFDITYKAKTDDATVINLTQHTYFNLSADPNRNILDHELHLKGEKYLPVDKNIIPTGEFQPVLDTPFDFRGKKRVGADIGVDNEQLKLGMGYDHCWIINDDKGEYIHFATVFEPVSGRQMECWTTEPGVQLYTGNSLDGSLVGKNSIRYNKHCALCLETQHYPDAPNQSNFPSTLLLPGEVYHSRTSYKFGVR